MGDKWISVKDKLPNHGRRVPVWPIDAPDYFYDGLAFWEARFEPSIGWVCGPDNTPSKQVNGIDIAYWYDLPVPPKESE